MSTRQSVPKHAVNAVSAQGWCAISNVNFGSVTIGVDLAVAVAMIVVVIVTVAVDG